MNAADFQPIIDWLTAHPNWVVFSIALIAFVESLALAGIVVPGVLFLFLVAALAGNLSIPIWEILVAGFAGAALGDGFSFYIGHFFKHSLRQYWPFSRYPKALKLGEDFFSKHGGKSIIIGRFIGPIRPVLPLIAGMLGMSQIRFISFNLFSALAWSPFYLLPGYLTGTAAHSSLSTLTLPEHFYLVMATLIVTLTIIAFIFRYLNLALQQENTFYKWIERKKQCSVHTRRMWIFLTRHHADQREFPLASLSLFILSSLFFWLWSFLTLQTSLLQSLDHFMMSFASNVRSEWLDTILIALTLLGDERFLYCSFTIFVGVLIAQRRPIAAAHLVVAGLSTAAITHALKYGFAVPRPELVFYAPTSFAYPSGHSSGAAILYGLVASFIAQEKTQTQRWKIYLALGAPILLIALSRVLLGVHWLSDIFGGVLLGLALCAATRIIYSRYSKTEQRKMQLKPSQNRRAVIIGLILWLGLCLGYQASYFSATLTKFQI
jgi:membrane protein DedA with SNARE-associated domain/membrane-associated phospholipid phosphatase